MRAARDSLLFASVTVAFAAFIAPVQGAMLVGANDPALDAPNLQAAADAGGQWLLTGTFDLGPTGRVVMRNDVTFEGGVGANGEKATIKGGDWAFLSPLPFSTVVPAAQTPFALPPITGPGPRIVVRNLVFDGPKGAAIQVAYSSHLEVTGNTIRNVHRRQLTPTYARHAGIDVGTHTYLLGELRALPAAAAYYHLLAPRRRQNTFIPGAVNGEVIIASNSVEVDPASATEPITQRSFGHGVFMNFLDGAMVRVSENTIKGAARTGIEVWEPRYGPTGAGSFLIERNHIATASLGAHSGAPAPNGILVGWVINPSGATDPAMNVPALIRRNRIEMNGASEWVPPPYAYQSASAGITSLADRSVIEGNDIKTNDPSHLGITVSNAHALVRANTVEGAKGLGALRAASAPIQVQVPDTSPDQWIVTAADENAFIGNHIGRFTANRTIFPRASSIIVLNYSSVAPRNNVFVGSGGQEVTVTDLGIGTKITGYKPVSGGVGDVLHEVLSEPFPFKLP